MPTASRASCYQSNHSFPINRPVARRSSGRYRHPRSAAPVSDARPMRSGGSSRLPVRTMTMPFNTGNSWSSCRKTFIPSGRVRVASVGIWKVRAGGNLRSLTRRARGRWRGHRRGRCGPSAASRRRCGRSLGGCPGATRSPGGGRRRGSRRFAVRSGERLAIAGRDQQHRAPCVPQCRPHCRPPVLRSGGVRGAGGGRFDWPGCTVNAMVTPVATMYFSTARCTFSVVTLLISSRDVNILRQSP